MDIHNTDVNIVEKVWIELYAITGWEKDHDLLVFLFLQESKKQLEFFVSIN